MKIFMEAHINLFWTGGWDSTFRLLYLLIKEKQVVQPYYIIDPHRKSTLNEFRAMGKIRSELFKRFPETVPLLRSTHFSLRSDIQLNQSITDNYERLAKKIHMGKQYEWIPRFVHQHQIYDMELGLVSRSISNGTVIQDLMRPAIIGQGHNCRLDALRMDDDLSIFKYFRFPLFYLTKIDMENLAIEYNFRDILFHIWFCHKPVRGKYPCGKCAPCKIAKASGHKIDKSPARFWFF